MIALGVLFEWATIPLIILWPVLALRYRSLAVLEEKEMAERFGGQWHDYAARTGMFLPRLKPLAC